MSRFASSLVLASLLLLAGCEMLGIESPEKVAAAREADGKAIGGACRHAARAIEDCYALNKKADRAAIFAGWRDMNDYMRENKIEPVPPQIAGKPAPTAPRVAEDEAESEPAPKAKVAGAKPPRDGKHEGS
ncbi:hypothetical protein [Piscinibacter koreensis]|uniref:Lipoprotein n=1 Tax=Piscinibacter koreensis TaxID=2742824 RepID=A0A7Y6TWS6_9BURK|nr:hypothetical protein [Schlegelella koreensis]NUZ06439.1 hypothetical protein [Schlegelella koreensis]